MKKLSKETQEIVDKAMDDLDQTEEDFHYLKDILGYNVVGTYLYGSQNYELDDEDSDIDTLSIVIPDMKDLVHKPTITINKEYERENGIMVVKDIFSFFRGLFRGNVNMLEILFSTCVVSNSRYKNLVEELEFIREDIAHLREDDTITCMLGMIRNLYKKIENNYKDNYDKITGKDLSNLVRIKTMVYSYIAGKTFDDCLALNNDKEIIELCKNLKRGKVAPEPYEAYLLAKDLYDNACETAQEYNNMTSYVKKHTSQEIEEIMDEVWMSLCKQDC